MPILETIGLERRFGGIIATHDVNLSVEKGARHALIGPNGAGKTTVINLLTGVLRPTAGPATGRGYSRGKSHGYALTGHHEIMIPLLAARLRGK